MYSVAEIQKIVSPIAAKYGVHRMYLFGSYATGKSTLKSDVDLRIDKGSVKGMQMAFLLSDLEDALHLPVDLLSTSALDARFLQAIKGEEKLLYERS
ncbi:MAG: nucleotidyltransferase domain-containing protein [Clostridia bacterium]|nr:nucleotidyltransferase domain-containing protein [Clostridia bacterium]